MTTTTMTQTRPDSIVEEHLIGGEEYLVLRSLPRPFRIALIVVTILSHAEFGPNDHREYAAHFKMLDIQSFESEVKAYCDAFGWEMPTFTNEKENDDLRKLEGGAFYIGARRYKDQV